MIEVINNYHVDYYFRNNYHVDYYFRNKIIDCGQISESLHLKLEETQRPIDDEINIEELEKLEIYLRSCQETQHQETQQEDTTDTYSQYYDDNTSQLYDTQIIKTKIKKPIDNHKKIKKELPQTKRIAEFSLRKRNVLLDKISKPKLKLN